MNSTHRREFLRMMAAAGGTLAMTPLSAFAASDQGHSKAKGSTRLPNPKFYWGLGLENGWIAQTNLAKDGNRRLLDVFLQMQHYERWKEDLDLAAGIGVNTIRYSVPWYKAEPRPGEYDWSWIDKPVEYMVNKLKIIPVMDLIHYGTPTWMEDGVIDDRYPEAIAKYASAMATHFRGLVNHYTPQNEPQITSLFCGLIGRWPPYQKSYDSWCDIGMRVAKATLLEVEAIRGAVPDAVIISADPFVFEATTGFLPKGNPQDPQYKELRMAAAIFPSCLTYGRIGEKHAFIDLLLKHGVKPDDISWVAKHAQKPDILGFNYYPDIHAYGGEGDYTRHGKLPLSIAARQAADVTEMGLLDAYEFFQLPIYLTETSAGLTTEAKVAYMNALYESVLRLRQDGLPLHGVNWWPLYDTIQWDYREGVDKPLTDFIRPGGWNNGLYTTKKTANLERVQTDAAKAYGAIIRKDAALLKKS